MDKTKNKLKSTLKEAISIGEGQTIEFKESLVKIDREIVGFANSSGGTIFCGITDKGEIKSTDISNNVRSQIYDIARNCDPSITLDIEILPEKVIKIIVPESTNKPHQCSSGFYMRIGPNTQKLNANEIKKLLRKNQTFFETQLNELADFNSHFSENAYNQYCNLCGINSNRNKLEILENLSVLRKINDKTLLSNAGVLLFTDEPRELLPESYLVAVRYHGKDKFSILDRKDFYGNIIEQIDKGIEFTKRHIALEYEISGNGVRVERYAYPLIAIREALINSLVHRDYSFQNSCVYLNIFSDRMEIENPGGIFGDSDISQIEGKSIRRNPLISDLLYRAGYGEKLGSGLPRIKEALKENSNPPYQVSNTNFFQIRFLPRINNSKIKLEFSNRQLEIISLLENNKKDFSSAEIAELLNVSPTTIYRDMKSLLKNKIIKTKGIGKAVRYFI